MIIPFVNWGWKRKRSPDVQFNFDISKRVREFTEVSREYDSRLHSFESMLDEHQYKAFMDLRNCANRVVIANDRLEFYNDIIDSRRSDL